MKTTTTQSERTWSLLDPRPVLVYLEQHDEYIVYWNGWVMTQSQAQYMALRHINIYPTQEVRDVMQETYERLYYAGAFDTRDWDHIVRSNHTFDFILKYMRSHLEQHCWNRDAREILSWFAPNRARVRS